MIVKGIGTTDIEKRKAIYKELYKELSDDPPVILLNYRKLLYAHNARIKGIDPESTIASVPTYQCYLLNNKG